MTVIAAGPLDLTGFHSTNEIVPSDLVVDLSTETWKTIMRLVVPVQPGDLLDVSAWMKVTDDLGYTVGLGEHLWWYDVDNGLGAAGTWSRLDPEAGSAGMNVTKDVHHLTLGVAVPFVVPADWPVNTETGKPHRICVALRADAHSTLWDKDGNGLAEDRLTMDKVGRLTVRRYTQRTEA